MYGLEYTNVSYEGVYLIWTLPSFIILAIFKNIAKNIKQNNQKDKIKLIEKKEMS